MENATFEAPVDTSVETPTPDASPKDAPEPATTDKGDPKPEPKERPEAKDDSQPKHKIKSKGKELELSLEEVLKRAELAEGADQTFKDAKREREEAKKEREANKAELARLERLRSKDADPLPDLIDTVGLDRLLEIAGQLKEQERIWNGLTDAQRDQLLREHEGEEAKRRLSEYEQREKLTQEEQARNQAFDVINNEIAEALSSAKAQGIPLADLPDIGLEVVDAMVAVLDQIEDAEKRGIKYQGHVPSVPEIVAHVSERYSSRGKSYLAALDGKSLKSMLTPEQLKSLRQLEIDDLHGSHPLNKAVAPQAQEGPAWQKQEVQKYEDPFKALDKHYGVRR